MRILLLNSYIGSNQPEPVCFPVGLAYVASMLKEYELFCWDPNVVSNPMIELSRILDKFEPDLVGLSLRNIDSVISFGVRSYYEPFVSMVRIIKKKAPSSKLVVGGTGFSMFFREIMEKNPEIDFGVVSEGERAILKLAKNLDHPERVKNMVVRKEGGIVFTGRDDLVDFSNLSPPSRESFDLARYSKRPYSIGIQSKRGCNFKCIYCVHPHLVGRQLRLRPPKDVVDEIEELVNEHDIRDFYFVDSIFNFPPNHAREISQEISRRNLKIKWQADFRPDFLNARLMMEMVKAGCELFYFSPDGASNGAMRILGKNMDIRSVEKTANWVSKIENAKVGYSFMYDLPGENVNHLLGLARLFPKIMAVCRSKLQSLTLTKMRIYPYTPLYRIALKQGKIRADTDLIAPVYYNSKKTENILPYLLGGSFKIFRKMMDLKP